ncbi:hypothetical protein [Tunturiibacter psychrotolerans]|uniref:hypothetical protein n=1 Tax=Tunturiibacter psychrotolerans TaxID=3069686 RepID=UPI003D221683
MTAESVVSQLIGLLFAVMGGSILVTLKNLSADERRTAGGLLTALCLGTLIGATSGILAVQYRWLSPEIITSSKSNTDESKPAPPVVSGPVASVGNNTPARVVQSEPTDKPIGQNTNQAASVGPARTGPCNEPSPYLRDKLLSAATAIDVKRSANLISDTDAYKQLRSQLQTELK